MPDPVEDARVIAAKDILAQNLVLDARVILDIDEGEIVIFYAGIITAGQRANIRDALAPQIGDIRIEFFVGQEAERVMEILEEEVHLAGAAVLGESE